MQDLGANPEFEVAALKSPGLSRSHLRTGLKIKEFPIRSSAVLCGFGSLARSEAILIGFWAL